MRPAVRGIARQPHPVEQRADPRIEIGRGCREAEIADRLGQDVAHAHARIEAGERVLEHDLHAPPHRPQRAGRKIVDALAVEHHLAGGHVEQLQDRAADGRLAAAAFADQRQRLAARDLERDAVDRVDPCGRLQEAATDREVLLEIVDFEERAHAAATSSRGA